jgi:hypothetical protein
MLVVVVVVMQPITLVAFVRLVEQAAADKEQEATLDKVVQMLLPTQVQVVVVLIQIIVRSHQAVEVQVL